MSESTAHGRQLLKEKICLTALRLFHKRGIRQVKMDDIATTLSVSKRTLYEIYTNKMELLAEVLELQNRMNHDRLKRELKPEANTMDVLILVLKISVEELNKISVEFLEDLHRYPEALQKLEELEKRSDEENRRFLLIFDRLKDRKNRYYLCPRCRQTVRVPRGKGKIVITCPKCGSEIHGKS